MSALRSARAVFLIALALSLVGAGAGVFAKRPLPALAGEPRSRIDPIGGEEARAAMRADSAEALAALGAWEALVDP